MKNTYNLQVNVLVLDVPFLVNDNKEEPFESRNYCFKFYILCVMLFPNVCISVDFVHSTSPMGWVVLRLPSIHKQAYLCASHRY